MKTLNPQHIGLILGTFFAVVHLIWVTMVALGFAQWYLDFVISNHFVNNPFTIQAFDPVKALFLVAMTFIVGFVFGYIFAFIWNRVHDMVK